MPCQGLQIQRDCAANEDEKAARTEAFFSEVDVQIGIERLLVATAPATWVNNHMADPAMELAVIYKQAAMFAGEPEDLGRIIGAIFENRLREVAELIVEEHS